MHKNRTFGTLYKYELLKIFKNKVAVITFMVLFIFTFLQGEFEVSGNVTPEALEQYRTLSGRAIDDTLISELLDATDESGRIVSDSDIAYEDFNDWVCDVIGYGLSYSDLNETSLYQERKRTIQEAHELSCLTEAEEGYWADGESRISKPIVYHDTVVTAGVLEGTTNLLIMMVVIIATALSSVFAMETQRKTDPMIRASLCGNRELYFAKILAGMSYVLGAILILLGVFYAYIGIRWGFDGMEYAIQTYRPFSQMALTNLQLAGILIMLTILGSLLISAFSLFVSCITRNGIAAMAVIIGTHLGLFALSSMIPYGMRALSQFFCLMPATLVSSRLVYEFRLVNAGKLLTCYQAAPVLYILMTALFIIIGSIAYDRQVK
ncbi:MAG: ABC transporter permease [Lachnospiraceae bacterium]|nr:ABC transporter permease [Lachnospiraceae bacterium]